MVSRDPPVSAPPELKLQMCAAVLGLYVGAMDPNSDPHVHVANVLPTRPSFQLHNFLLFSPVCHVTAEQSLQRNLSSTSFVHFKIRLLDFLQRLSFKGSLSMSYILVLGQICDL